MTAVAALLWFRRPPVTPRPNPWRLTLMAALTVQNVTIGQTGIVSVLFSDGVSTEYPTASAVIADGTLTTDDLRKLLVARWVGLNPTVNSPGSINGTTLEVNMASVLSPVEYGSA